MMTIRIFLDVCAAIYLHHTAVVQQYHHSSGSSSIPGDSRSLIEARLKQRQRQPRHILYTLTDSLAQRNGIPRPLIIFFPLIPASSLK